MQRGGLGTRYSIGQLNWPAEPDRASSGNCNSMACRALHAATLKKERVVLLGGAGGEGGGGPRGGEGGGGGKMILGML